MDDTNNNKLTDEETTQLVSLLKKFEPGFLPFSIFQTVARLVVTPVIELVPLRKNAEEQIEVLLLSRGPDDPIWPNEVHIPGTVIRAYDFDNKTLPFNRIINDELQGTKINTPVFVMNNLSQSKRGTEQAEVYYAEVIGEPKVGQFFPANNLPEQVMKSQLGFIEAAVATFAKR